MAHEQQIDSCQIVFALLFIAEKTRLVATMSNKSICALQFLLKGKKRRNKTQFNFLISDDEYEMSRTGPGCIGKLRANASTTAYTLYVLAHRLVTSNIHFSYIFLISVMRTVFHRFDQGSNPKFNWKHNKSGIQRDYRKELMCISVSLSLVSDMGDFLACRLVI